MVLNPAKEYSLFLSVLYDTSFLLTAELLGSRPVKQNMYDKFLSHQMLYNKYLFLDKGIIKKSNLDIFHFYFFIIVQGVHCDILKTSYNVS
jgi:hypothetical protein